jgi:hypothetical protein
MPIWTNATLRTLLECVSEEQAELALPDKSDGEHLDSDTPIPVNFLSMKGIGGTT